MKLLSSTALVLCAFAFAAPATAQAPAQAQAAQPQKQAKVSQAAAKAIVALQTAVNANDLATLAEKVAAAKAAAKTPDDRYAIGELQLKAALASNNDALAAEAADYIAASGFPPASRISALYNAIGVKFFKANAFDKAAGLLEKAIAADPANPDSVMLLAEARNSQGKGAEAAQLLQKSIAMSTAAGRKPGEDVYKRATSLAYNAKSPAAVQLGRQWLAAYPNAESWRNAIAIYRNMMRPEVESTLDLLRLMRATNALSTQGDYTLYATAAAEQGNYGEAQAVIDEGIAAKKVDASSSLAADIIKGLKSKPKPTAADLATAEKDAKTGAAKMTVANRYFGMGNYAKSTELYRAALAGGADQNLANLHIGMALARAGDKAGAVTALKAVSGEYADVAAYWLLFVQGA